MRQRFAPSPTGLLHLGHGFSALTAWDRAQAEGGEFLLRIEDIDRTRARAHFERAIFDDLGWLGLSWPEPVLRQSGRMPAYDDAVARLADMGLCFPCRCTRADIKAALSAPQEGQPAQAPYPGTCRKRPMSDRGPGDAVRLNMKKALQHVEGKELPSFTETGSGTPARHRIDPAALIREHGDVVLARRDIGTSYHLAVVVDDAHQGITHVTRGRDLKGATPLHVLLQALLGLPVPVYHHHRLIRDETGKRLAKRDDARALRRYREEGLSPDDIRAMLGM